MKVAAPAIETDPTPYNPLDRLNRQELDGAWTVRFGPLPRDHMRAVLDHFAW